MERNKQLVIQLIIQDMKHEQLVGGLQQLGFQTDLHGSDISAIVAQLLGISENNITNDWLDVYMSFIRQSRQYTITDTGTSLLSLAETCYGFLKDSGIRQ